MRVIARQEWQRGESGRERVIERGKGEMKVDALQLRGLDRNKETERETEREREVDKERE